MVTEVNETALLFSDKLEELGILLVSCNEEERSKEVVLSCDWNRERRSVWEKRQVETRNSGSYQAEAQQQEVKKRRLTVTETEVKKKKGVSF